MKYFAIISAVAAFGAMSAARAVETATPDLNGVWQIITPVKMLTTATGAEPPFTAAAKQLYHQRMRQAQSGSRPFDLTLKCKPMGEPRTSYDPDGGPFEIRQNDREIMFGYTWNRMVRFVYITDKAPDVIGDSYYGTSTGVWRGDKLVVDTAGLHGSTVLDQLGMPHTEALHLTETYRLTNNDTNIEEIIHFDDPKSFTHPWDAKLLYRRLPGARIAEDVCEDRIDTSKLY